MPSVMAGTTMLKNTDIKASREWVLRFVHWYNHQHKHSGLKFMSPIERHEGRGRKILQKRHEVYVAAKARNPNRWSGETRNWDLPEFISLNPEKEQAILESAG